MFELFVSNFCDYTGVSVTQLKRDNQVIEIRPLPRHKALISRFTRMKEQ